MKIILLMQQTCVTGVGVKVGLESVCMSIWTRDLHVDRN